MFCRNSLISKGSVSRLILISQFGDMAGFLQDITDLVVRDASGIESLAIIEGSFNHVGAPRDFQTALDVRMPYPPRGPSSADRDPVD